jgi:hypothetical protein
MKTTRLTKKYKNKSSSKNRKNKKSRKRKNKSRKRILKGGVPSRGVIVSSSRNSSIRPSSRASSIKPSSRASSRASIRPNSRAGISKPKCCDPKSISDGERIIESIRNFPHTFNDFYNSLLTQSEIESRKNIPNMTQTYLSTITIQPQGAYLNIKGLQLISYLIHKYNTGSDEEKEKIKNIISLLDQYAAAPGVRYSDLEVIRKQLNKDHFECYKELYEKISSQLFRCGNGDCHPVSTSAISLYCKPRFKPTLKPIGE